MKKTKFATRPFDAANYLKTPEDMVLYLQACIDEAPDDAAFIAGALGDIARAKGMSEVARKTGMSRESLYKALSGNRAPGFDTILKVTAALGLRIQTVAPKVSKPKPRARRASA
jgi:probable addiction module antidote protein